MNHNDTVKQSFKRQAETFDLVITRLSLHHFTDPEKPFREMQRILKKGGK